MTAVTQWEVVLGSSCPLENLEALPGPTLAVPDASGIEQLGGVVGAAATQLVVGCQHDLGQSPPGVVLYEELAMPTGDIKDLIQPADGRRSAGESGILAMTEGFACPPASLFNFNLLDDGQDFEQALTQDGSGVYVAVEDDEPYPTRLEDVECFAYIDDAGENAVVVGDENNILWLTGAEHEAPTITLTEFAGPPSLLVWVEPSPDSACPDGFRADVKLEGVLEDSFLLVCREDLVVC